LLRNATLADAEMLPATRGRRPTADDAMQPAASPRANVLPASLPPLGLLRTEAAAYICVSPTTWDRMVRDGLMPKPLRVYKRRTIWDREKVHAAFKALDTADRDDDPWERMAL
jgi:predicted DNA-binding transcriptional regulator AlpA